MLTNYWETDKQKKLKFLKGLRFKHETSNDEEVFRFIFNN